MLLGSIAFWIQRIFIGINLIFYYLNLTIIIFKLFRTILLTQNIWIILWWWIFFTWKTSELWFLFWVFILLHTKKTYFILLISSYFWSSQLINFFCRITLPTASILFKISSLKIILFITGNSKIIVLLPANITYR